MALTLDSKIPAGPLADKWDSHKFDLKLVNPRDDAVLRRSYHRVAQRDARTVELRGGLAHRRLGVDRASDIA